MLVVCETNSSYIYHLRETDTPQYGGHSQKALCGRKCAWDTKIPVYAFGVTEGRWCKHCLEILKTDYELRPT